MPHSREVRHDPYGPAFHKMTRELTRSVNRINRRQNISYEFVFLAMPRETLPAQLCTSFGITQQPRPNSGILQITSCSWPTYRRPTARRGIGHGQQAW